MKLSKGRIRHLHKSNNQSLRTHAKTKSIIKMHSLSQKNKSPVNLRRSTLTSRNGGRKGGRNGGGKGKNKGNIKGKHKANDTARVPVRPIAQKVVYINNIDSVSEFNNYIKEISLNIKNNKNLESVLKIMEDGRLNLSKEIDMFYADKTKFYVNEFKGNVIAMYNDFKIKMKSFISKLNWSDSKFDISVKFKGTSIKLNLTLMYLIIRHMYCIKLIDDLFKTENQQLTNAKMLKYFQSCLQSTLQILFIETVPSGLLKQQNFISGELAGELWNSNKKNIMWGQSDYDDHEKLTKKLTDIRNDAGHEDSSDASSTTDTKPKANPEFDVIHGNFIKIFMQKLSGAIVTNMKEAHDAPLPKQNELLLHNSLIYSDIRNAITSFLFNVLFNYVTFDKATTKLSGGTPPDQTGMMLRFNQISESNTTSTPKQIFFMMLFIDPMSWSPLLTPMKKEAKTMKIYMDTWAKHSVGKIKAVKKILLSSKNTRIHDSLEFQNGDYDERQIQVIVHQPPEESNHSPPHYDIQIKDPELTVTQFFNALSSKYPNNIGAPVPARLSPEDDDNWQSIELGDPQKSPALKKTTADWVGPAMDTNLTSNVDQVKPVVPVKPVGPDDSDDSDDSVPIVSRPTSIEFVKDSTLLPGSSIHLLINSPEFNYFNIQKTIKSKSKSETPDITTTLLNYLNDILYR